MDELEQKHDEELVKLHDNILDTLSEIENEDETINMLEKAMNFFCGTYDICEGFKHALKETMLDQIQNHASEQELGDWRKLSDILNGAI